MAAIAFIGLGQMGSPMASNLLQQGHQLRVFDVNAEAVRHLVDKGATPAANPAQAAKDAEFIITMLPNGDLVRSGSRSPGLVRHSGTGPCQCRDDCQSKNVTTG